MVEIKIRFPNTNFSWLWPFDTILIMWVHVAYITKLLEIFTLVTMIRLTKVMVTVAKIETQLIHNNLSMRWPINSTFYLWVVYINTQLGVATHTSVIKVNVTLLKIEIHSPHNNLSLSTNFYQAFCVRTLY